MPEETKPDVEQAEEKKPEGEEGEEGDEGEETGLLYYLLVQYFAYFIL